MTTFYHFTDEDHLDRILVENVLRTTDPNLLKGDNGNDRVVWLLDTPTVEYDHGLGVGGRIIGAFEGEPVRMIDKHAIRIAVDVDDARQWLKWLTTHRHDPDWIRAIVKAGGGKIAARHWFVVPRPIPSSEWVEVRDMRKDAVIRGRSRSILRRKTGPA